MSSLDERFAKAQADIKAFTKRPKDDELLEIYGLYKQATEGDISADRPGMLDLKGKAKWDAWNKLKGLAQNEAKEKYIANAQALAALYA